MAHTETSHARFHINPLILDSRARYATPGDKELLPNIYLCNARKDCVNYRTAITTTFT